MSYFEFAVIYAYCMHIANVKLDCVQIQWSKYRRLEQANPENKLTTFGINCEIIPFVAFDLDMR